MEVLNIAALFFVYHNAYLKWPAKVIAHIWERYQCPPLFGAYCLSCKESPLWHETLRYFALLRINQFL